MSLLQSVISKVSIFLSRLRLAGAVYWLSTKITHLILRLSSDRIWIFNNDVFWTQWHRGNQYMESLSRSNAFCKLEICTVVFHCSKRAGVDNEPSRWHLCALQYEVNSSFFLYQILILFTQSLTEKATVQIYPV